MVGGHTLDTLTYFSVVKREIVCFALTMVALYDLDVKAADVLNDYMMASNKEKMWTVLAPEFGDNAGKYAIIFRALDSLKSVGASFRAHLAQYMQEWGYQSCDATLMCG